MFASTHLVIMPEYRDCLIQAGFDSYGSLALADLGEPIADEEGKQLRRLVVSAGDRQESFFLKRGWGVMPVRWMIKKWLRLSWPHSPAWDEFNAIQRLEEHGFPVMKAAAWGERRVCGIATEGFLLVAEVEGQCADEIWLGADAALRKRMMCDVGKLIGCLHRSGFFAFVRFKDLICREVPADPDETIEFTLIDRECSPHRPLPATPKRSYDALAEGLFVLLHSTREPTPCELSCFAKSYLAETHGYPTTSQRELLAGTARATREKFTRDDQRSMIDASSILN
jgi:hypothetical protein